MISDELDRQWDEIDKGYERLIEKWALLAWGLMGGLVGGVIAMLACAWWCRP